MTYGWDKLKSEAKDFAASFQSELSVFYEKGRKRNPYQELTELAAQLDNESVNEEEKSVINLKIGDIFHLYQKSNQAKAYYELAQKQGKESINEFAATASLGVLFSDQGEYQEAREINGKWAEWTD